METVGGRVGSIARAAGGQAGNQRAVKLGAVIVYIVIVLYLNDFHGVCAVL